MLRAGAEKGARAAAEAKCRSASCKFPSRSARTPRYVCASTLSGSAWSALRNESRAAAASPRSRAAAPSATSASARPPRALFCTEAGAAPRASVNGSAEAARAEAIRSVLSREGFECLIGCSAATR